MIYQKYSKDLQSNKGILYQHAFNRYFWEANGNNKENVYCEQSGTFRTVCILYPADLLSEN